MSEAAYFYPLTGDDYLSWLAQNDIAYRTIGTGYSGSSLIAIEQPGQGQPVLITAGSHACEPAGIAAALWLAKNWRWPFPLSVVALRDPFGCGSYADLLGAALDKPVQFCSYPELQTILLQNAKRVLAHDENGLTLVEIQGILFSNIPRCDGRYGPLQNTEAIDQFFHEHPSLAEEMVGRRVVTAANYPPSAEKVGQYDRVYTAVIAPGGKFANLNRCFGGEFEADEVRALRQYTDQLRPCLTLDLHEGFGSSYYFFVPEYACGTRQEEIVRIMAAAAAACCPAGPYRMADLQLASPLAPKRFYEPIPGVMADKPLPAGHSRHGLSGTTFCGYAAGFGPALTVESGTEADFSSRVKIHLASASAVLDNMASQK